MRNRRLLRRDASPGGGAHGAAEVAGAILAIVPGDFCAGLGAKKVDITPTPKKNAGSVTIVGSSNMDNLENI